MSEAITVALIVAIPPTIVGVGGLIIGLRNKGKIQEVKVELNSHLKEWNEMQEHLANVRSDASYAKGKEDQRQAEK